MWFDKLWLANVLVFFSKLCKFWYSYRHFRKGVRGSVCGFTLGSSGRQFSLHVYENIKVYMRTLKYLINEHARLTISPLFSTLLALIRSCSLNYFSKFFLPACKNSVWYPKIGYFYKLFKVISHNSCIKRPQNTLFVFNLEKNDTFQLIILSGFPSCSLIRSCSLNFFLEKFHPALLLGLLAY